MDKTEIPTENRTPPLASVTEVQPLLRLRFLPRCSNDKTLGENFARANLDGRLRLTSLIIVLVR